MHLEEGVTTMATTMPDFQRLRAHMVNSHVVGRGITEPKILDAFRTVPREAFLPEDSPSSPTRTRRCRSARGRRSLSRTSSRSRFRRSASRERERVLEVGTGSGYAAAMLGTHREGAFTRSSAFPRSRIRRGNASPASDSTTSTWHVRDGSLGWPEHAPYDAIAVAAGRTEGAGRPAGAAGSAGAWSSRSAPDEASQVLMRITRESETEYREEHARGRSLRAPHRRAGMERRAAHVMRAPKRSAGVSRARGARPRGRRANRRHRRPLDRRDARADRGRASRPPRRGHARHERVLPDARAHHPRAHRAARLPVRRRRGRLARRRPRRRLRPR